MEKKRLQEIIDRFDGRKIAVWGDLILDEYLYGTTRRISREAPVLILSHQKTNYYLGGAGNTLINLKALDAEPLFIGFAGRDSTGDRLVKILRENSLSTEYLIRNKDITTPLKTRILAGEESTRKQQILRIDREHLISQDESLRSPLLSFLKKAAGSCEAMLVSDYHYDAVKEDIFSEVLSEMKAKKIPVALDSRFRMLRFKGTTLATPNESEVENALQIDTADENQIMDAGRKLLQIMELEALLITRGAKGMILFEPERPPFSIPIHGTADIVDVTGAGDTVISVMTLALASGANFREAAVLANIAGGIVVMKKGTAAVTRRELKEALVS